MTISDEIPVPKSLHPFDPAEAPGARQHGTAGREEIRHTTHRVMPARQSAKPPERSGQNRSSAAARNARKPEKAP